MGVGVEIDVEWTKQYKNVGVSDVTFKDQFLYKQ
jgi:hypothetical protein